MYRVLQYPTIGYIPMCFRSWCSSYVYGGGCSLHSFHASLRLFSFRPHAPAAAAATAAAAAAALAPPAAAAAVPPRSAHNRLPSDLRRRWKIEEETFAEGAGKTVVKTFGFTTPGQYKARYQWLGLDNICRAKIMIITMMN